MRGLSRFVALLGVVVALVGCGGSGDTGREKEPGLQNSPQTTGSSNLPPSSSPGSDIWGRHFVVTVATNSHGNRLLSGRIVRFAFSHEGIYYVSWGGCNEFGGTVHLSAIGMKVANISTTRAGCEPKEEAEEKWLARLIESEPRLHLDGERLTLKSAVGSVELMGFVDPTLCPLSSTGGVIHLGNSQLGCYGAEQFVAMYLMGHGQPQGGWICRHSEKGGGWVRVVCRREGDKWFRIEGPRKWIRTEGLTPYG